MYHKVRRKMEKIVFTILLYSTLISALPKAFDIPENVHINDIDNDIIDFDDEYTIKYNKKYGVVPWSSDNFKESYKYTIVKDPDHLHDAKDKSTVVTGKEHLSVVPLEQTTNLFIDETTVEPDLTVIPLRNSTGSFDTTTTGQTVEILDDIINSTEPTTSTDDSIVTTEFTDASTTDFNSSMEVTTEIDIEVQKSNSSEVRHDRNVESDESHEDVPVFTELDTEDGPEVPEDYYDSKDIVPTQAPKTDALSVLFGFAGSVVEGVVESVAERLMPKGIFDLFKRMQRQSEALEAERLRSKEENGGIGQFTRGVIKSISSGLGGPLSQLMAGVRDMGSLDSDRGFVSSVASGVTSVANSMVDMFKDRVQAIYPGTVWCGDGHSAQARSSDLGLFFFTDTCCRQHDACKLYIAAGETKFGLTNTGLFTRSHCSCDAKFRECLRKTNSLVSAQIGLTYFNVLGPQCFRRTHPIVKCVRRTR
ncbi:unnamed protein product [Leptidea sinapis]|uniref:phospholipase A2 n=1 Tax=Leptidea sinapis TaxID=189913 RepID=A0A5E4QTF3_9NEOP|nr:unnamed protein product [Leptidea sinapis]